MKNLMLLFLTVLPLAQGSISAQSSRKEMRIQKQEEEFRAMQAFIDSANYTFDAERAIPSGGRTIDLSSHTSYLTVSGDSIEVYLPFFGQAYNIAYSNHSGGFKFSAPINNYSKQINEKKKSILIGFSARFEGDSMDFTLDIFGSGSASLTIISTNRKPISYGGRILEKE